MNVEDNKAPRWHFKKFARGDTDRNPIQSEFFAQDSISEPGKALIREAVQNSLDARGDRDADKLLIRIFLSERTDSLPPAHIAPFFTGIWDHYRAPNNGLIDAPAVQSPCPFLVIEDFGTTGLEGDECQWHRSEVPNPFYTFFRAEGQSDKHDDKRGRWGVGKFVFPRSSRASTFFGLTRRRSDGRVMLLGRTILKSHQIRDKENPDEGNYVPDGYFGRQEGDFTYPIEDPEIIRQFSERFRLQRTTESGLSIVIPWYDEEITYTSILKAIIEEYFFPIMASRCEVVLETPGKKFHLTATTLREVMRDEGLSEETHILPILDLVDMVLNPRDNPIEVNGDNKDGSPRWSEDSISDEQCDLIRQQLRDNGRVAIRVPTWVRPKNKDPEQSHFDIYVKQDEDAPSKKPVFVREDIIISEAGRRMPRGYHSLVVIDKGPLASCLGDAENPSHTRWQRDSANFRHKYAYGDQTIRFVTHSVKEILNSIAEDHAEEEDRDLLADWFSVARPDEPQRPRRRRRKVRPVGPLPVPRPKRFRTDRIDNGFCIVPGDVPIERPIRMRIRTAYNVRRGSVFSSYHEADFKLNERPIEIQKRGMEVLNAAMNVLEVSVLEPDFRLEVTGFDPNRDLVVDARVVEVSDGDSEN